MSTSFHDLRPLLLFAAFLTPGAYFNARGGRRTKCVHESNRGGIDARNTASFSPPSSPLPPLRPRHAALALLPSFPSSFAVLISPRGYWGDNVVFRRFPRSSALSASFAARYIARRARSERPANLPRCESLCWASATLTEACPCRQATIRMSKYIFVQSGCAT